MNEKVRRFLRPSNFDGLATDQQETVSVDYLINMDIRVGEEIKHLRRARNTTIAYLSKATGLSVGYLSQIETGKSRPSIKALHAISRALGVTISWFFSPAATSDDDLRDFVVRRNARRSLHFQNGIVDELLSPNLGRQLELLKCTFPPGASSGDEPYKHEGEESGIVMSGRLDLWVGERHIILNQGDSFAFESDIPHRYENRTDEDTIVVWAITPPSY